MAFLLLLLLVALPVAELALLVRVASEIGVLDTLAILFLVGLAGTWIAKRVGLGALRRIRQAQVAGRAPSREVAGAGLALLGAILLIIPGFISDAVGILLLLPPTRVLFRSLVLRWYAHRGPFVVVRRTRVEHRVGDHDHEIWDVESWEETPGARRRGEIGGGP
jgi:UPF0716 protein FxsA